MQSHQIQVSEQVQVREQVHVMLGILLEVRLRPHKIQSRLGKEIKIEGLVDNNSEQIIHGQIDLLVVKLHQRCQRPQGQLEVYLVCVGCKQ